MIIVNGRFLTQKMTGVQRYALEISLCLQQLLGDEMKVVVPSSITDEQLNSRLNTEKIGTHSGQIWEQCDLPRWLRKNGSPLLCSFCGVPPVFYPNKIHTLHDITFVRYPETFTLPVRMWYYAAFHLAFRNIKSIMTVSDFSQREISEYYGIDESKIALIPGASFGNITPIEDAELKAKKYILAVSTLKENKNFECALESFRLASEKHKDLELVIIGDLNGIQGFSSVNKIIEELKSCDRVRLVGRVGDEELVRYYSNARAFIFPSFYEGFGLPVLEAQKCGCPVVSTNAASLPYVLGDSALMCDPEKPEEFAEAIDKILTDPELEQELKRKGMENQARFSFERSAGLVVDLIRKLGAGVG